MDSTKFSMADFMNLPEMDVMARADRFYEFIQDIKQKHHFQYKRVAIEGSQPVRRVIDPYTGEIREMIYLASNDYLNLTRHPKVVKAGLEAVEKYGAGAGSVPLLGGTLDLHIRLAEKVAEFKGCEDAIIYTSGFGSNAGTLLSILQKEDVAIIDMLAHASIVDGCKNTNLKPFRHNDMKSLENVLKRSRDVYRTKLVIVDGVYSMDGDIAPLDDIIEISQRYGAYVMVDEAHATGVIGKTGRGTPQHFNVEGKVDIVAGTFSKGLGSVGGFIAAKKELIQLLDFYSRTYMFSTAMVPQVAASLIAAMEVIEEEPHLRENLWENINYFRENLLQLGFDLGNSQTAIFPVIIGNDLTVKEMCRMLHERNIYVNPVLYPAVPKKLARIRMSIMTNHTRENLDVVLNAMEDLGRKFSLI